MAGFTIPTPLAIHVYSEIVLASTSKVAEWKKLLGREICQKKIYFLPYSYLNLNNIVNFCSYSKCRIMILKYESNCHFLDKISKYKSIKSISS